MQVLLMSLHDFLLAQLLDFADDLRSALELQVRTQSRQLRHWFAAEDGVARRQVNVNLPVVQASVLQQPIRCGALLWQLALPLDEAVAGR